MLIEGKWIIIAIIENGFLYRTVVSGPFWLRFSQYIAENETFHLEAWLEGQNRSYQSYEINLPHLLNLRFDKTSFSSPSWKKIKIETLPCGLCCTMHNSSTLMWRYIATRIIRTHTLTHEPNYENDSHHVLGYDAYAMVVRVKYLLPITHQTLLLFVSFQ